MGDIYADGELTTGSNDGTSWADAYRGAAGLQTAFDNASAGDTVHVTRTFTLAAGTPIDADQGSGSAGQPIGVIGYNYNSGSPVNDGTRAVLDAGGAAAHCLNVDDVDDWVVENVDFRNATGDNVYVTSTDNALRWVFLNCVAHGSSGGDG